MDDGTQYLDLYDVLLRHAPRPRRWWEKQRFIIPLAVLLLAPPVFFVAGQAAGRDRAAAAAGADPTLAASAATDPAGAAAAGDGGGTGSEHVDPEGLPVCGRVLALREQLQMQGVDAPVLYREVRALQREAAGTPLAAAVDEVVRTMEGYVSGDASGADVAAAGAELLAAC